MDGAHRIGQNVRHPHKKGNVNNHQFAPKINLWVMSDWILYTSKHHKVGYPDVPFDGSI